MYFWKILENIYRTVQFSVEFIKYTRSIIQKKKNQLIPRSAGGGTDECLSWSACGYIEKLAEKMNPSVQKLGSRGIFQHESKPKKKEFSKEAKVTTVSWLSMFYRRKEEFLLCDL